MRKIFSVVLVTAVFFVLSANTAVARRNERRLTDYINNMEVCRVCILDFKNSSGNADASPEVHRQMLVNALRQRTSHNFMIVDNPSEADIVVNADIKKFLYSEEDPVYDGIIGMGMTPVNPAGLAMDIAMDQNYVENDIEYDITDSKGRKLWNGTVDSNVTKSDMPLNDAVELVGQRSARNLFMKCFKKDR
ncbi:MAG: hypothetical protein JW728_05700 [Candidatus Aureabacteria bacterium]|nr:hypothetical protein [Candidatus Auribacterota bacterium]